MSGHSKWANIKHRKGAQDALRARQFTKAGREIVIAAKLGGGDPDSNARLRAAIVAARDVNMPKDRIEAAIKKGCGESAGENFEEVVYEGHGPAGVAVYVNVLTDNRNRTASEMRFVFTKHGGELGSPGSVAWMFERKGTIEVPAEGVTEDRLVEVVLEAGGEDVRAAGETFEVFTAPENFSTIREAIEAAGIKVARGEVAMIPKNLVHVEGKKAEQLLALLEALEEHDDVQKVAANCEILDPAAP